MFSTFEKIKELAKKQGKSLGSVEEDLGYGRNTLYKIKNSTPNAERISEIANYFNVSTDYLLGRTDNPNMANEGDGNVTTNPLEEQALVMFRKNTSGMSDDDIAKFNTALKGLMATARALIQDDSNWE